MKTSEWGKRMAFGHEKLDVYRTAIEYASWAYRLCERLKRASKREGSIDQGFTGDPLEHRGRKWESYGRRPQTLF